MSLTDFFEKGWEWLRILDKDLKELKTMDELFIDEHDFKLFKESGIDYLELTRNIFDKYTNMKKMKRKSVKLYLICCYIIVIKYYSDCWLSYPNRFIWLICDDLYSIKKINKAELKILKTLDYKFGDIEQNKNKSENNFNTYIVNYSDTDFKETIEIK